MSAIVPLNGKTRQLDRTPGPDEKITPDQVQDTSRMARLLTRLTNNVAAIGRRFWPQHIDFEDVTVDATGTTKYRFPHKFGSRVRWWPVDVTAVTTLFSTNAPCLVQHSDTDNNTLVLVSYIAATFTLRVEEAG